MSETMIQPQEKQEKEELHGDRSEIPVVTSFEERFEQFYLQLSERKTGGMVVRTNSTNGWKPIGFCAAILNEERVGTFAGSQQLRLGTLQQRSAVRLRFDVRWYQIAWHIFLPECFLSV